MGTEKSKRKDSRSVWATQQDSLKEKRREGRRGREEERRKNRRRSGKRRKKRKNREGGEGRGGERRENEKTWPWQVCLRADYSNTPKQIISF